MLAAARTVVAFGIILQVAGFRQTTGHRQLFWRRGLTALDAYYLGLVIPTFLTGVSGGHPADWHCPAYVSTRGAGDEPAPTGLGKCNLDLDRSGARVPLRYC